MRKYWKNLSRRERILTGAAGAMLVFSGCFLMIYRAVENVNQLDKRVGQLEQELLNLRDQEAKSASAESAFREMAAEHSSEWTEQEIQDRLRIEIYRLALRDVNKQKPRQRDYMVRIRTLRAGTLHDEEEGYREYQLGFRLESAKLMDVIRFVERLQKSKQSLRLDGLDITRNPAGTEVSTFLDITRTILNSTPEDAETDTAPDSIFAGGGFERWDGNGAPAGWDTNNCALSPNEEFATDGTTCLKVAAQGGGAQVYALQSLAGGRSYRMELDIIANGRVIVGAGDPATGRLYDGARAIDGNGEVYRCVFTFTPPGDPTGTREVWAPLVRLEGAGSTAYIDDVRLRPMEY